MFAKFQDGGKEIKNPGACQNPSNKRPDENDGHCIQPTAAAFVLGFVLNIRIFMARVEGLVPGDPMRPVPFPPGLQSTKSLCLRCLFSLSQVVLLIL